MICHAFGFFSGAIVFAVGFVYPNELCIIYDFRLEVMTQFPSYEECLKHYMMVYPESMIADISLPWFMGQLMDSVMGSVVEITKGV